VFKGGACEECRHGTILNHPKGRIERWKRS